MKKLFALMFAGLFLMYFVGAGNISSTEESNLSDLTCVGGVHTKSVAMYVDGNQELLLPSDSFANNCEEIWDFDCDSAIIPSESSVKVWSRANSVTECDDWYRVSNIVPAGTRVDPSQNNGRKYTEASYKVVIREGSHSEGTNGCFYNKPTYTKNADPLAKDAVVAFDIGYYLAPHSSSYVTNYMRSYWYYRGFNENNWTCFPGHETVPGDSPSSCPDYNLGYEKQVRYINGDCVEYRMFWCGDGIVNLPSGLDMDTFEDTNPDEVCDPGLDSNCLDDCSGYKEDPLDPVCMSITPSDDPLVFEQNESFDFVCHGNSDTVKFRAEIYHNGSIVRSLTEIKNVDGSNNASFTKILSNPPDSNWSLSCVAIDADGGESSGGDICKRDITLNSTPSSEVCGDGILQDGENCESNGTSTNIITPGVGCGSDCLLDDVVCDLNLRADAGGDDPHTGVVPHSVIFAGRTNSYADFVNLVFGDGDSVVPEKRSITHGRKLMRDENHTYDNAGNYVPTLSVINAYDGLIRDGTTSPTAECSTDVTVTEIGPQCGDGHLDPGEECEFSDGSPTNIVSDPASGCDSDCKLRDIDCWLYVYDSSTTSTHTGIVPFTEGFGGRSLLWAEFGDINYGDGSSDATSIGGGNPPWLYMDYLYHTYEAVGHYEPTWSVKNKFDEIIRPGVTIPEAECSTYVDVIGSPDVWVEKINLDSGVIYPAGGEVTFRINFGNDGNVATVADVYDVLPEQLTYLTSSIYHWDGVPWLNNSGTNPIPYPISVVRGYRVNSKESLKNKIRVEHKNNVTDILSWFMPTAYAAVQIDPSISPIYAVYDSRYNSFYHTDHYFAYSGVELNPGASGYVLVTAKVADICDGVFDNTGFVQEGGNVISDIADFECDDNIWIQKKQSVNGGPLTTGNVYVKPYDFVEYTILFSSDHEITDTYLYDLIPAGMKFISGDMLPPAGNPMYSGWAVDNIQEYVQSQNFDMDAELGYYANITVQVVGGFEHIGTIYRNVATLEGVSSSVVAILTGNLPQLSIEKELTNTGFYLGEEVGFRINFENNGYSPATGIVITDLMPSSLAYNGNYTVVGASYEGPIITNLADGSHKIIFDNMTIAPFTQGYILLTGVVQNYDGQSYLCDNATNWVFMSGSVLSGSLYDDAQFDCSAITIEKFVTDENGNNLNTNGAVPSYISGNVVLFEVEVNGLSDGVSNVVLEDIWPDVNQDCVKYLGREGQDWSQPVGSNNNLTRTYNGSNNEAHLFLSGLIVSDSDSCVGTYVNTGTIIYTLGGEENSISDDAEFAISSYNMVIQKTSDIDETIQQGDLVTFTLAIENRGTEPISNVVISDIWPGTLDIVPDPDTTENWYDYNGVGSITSTNITDIEGGLLLEWFFPSGFEFMPGETGEIVIVGRLVR